MISYTLKSFVDTLMVGHLGLDALAGVGFAGVLVWTLISFPLGALRGQRPLISQYLGAGDKQATRIFGVHASYFAFGISLVFLFFVSGLGVLI
jgi:Na+-driven multidrug efflux pump